MSRFFARGIPVTGETLALEVIDRVARADSAVFLMEDHTYENFQTSLFLPKLLDRTRYDAWAEAGSQDMQKRCNQEARRLLNEHQVISKPDEVLERIQRVVDGSAE